MFFSDKKLTMVAAADALPDNPTAVAVPERHYVLSSQLRPPFADNLSVCYFGMGCFWGAERLFWSPPGIFTTAVGYQGGYTANARYEQVCTGLTGHAETVMVVYDPEQLSFATLLHLFWEHHDPTQGMRQGNDNGTQYRSLIMCTTREQLAQASLSREVYQQALTAANCHSPITTEIAMAQPFYYAESAHQQYLGKNPQGYCGLAGCGIDFPQES